MMHSTTYRPDVDGLRAVAVIGVILFHANLGLPGGYVGVDVFFVISGYLITTLILRDAAAGKFSLATFWERRVRRIIPALAVVVTATLLAAVFILTPRDLTDLCRSLLAQAVFASNLYFWKTHGYFNSDSDFKPLLHTWSLSIEEQFYLGFPLLLLLLPRLGLSRFRLLLLGLGFASLAASIYAAPRHPMAAFYLLPARAWELLAGSVLAAWTLRTKGATKALPRWMTETGAWLGLAALVTPMAVYDADTVFPGLAAIPPVAGTVLVIWAGQHRVTLLGRVLASRPLVGVGLVSYSLYLWHFPALVLLRYWHVEMPPWPARVAVVALVAVLSYGSWRYVEMPLRRRSLFATRRRLFAAGATAIGLLAVAAMGLIATDGLPQRFDPELKRYLVADGELRQINATPLRAIRSGQLPVIGVAGADGSSAPELLIWGDSHAQVLIPLLASLCEQHGIRAGVAVRGGVTPLVNYHSISERAGIRRQALAWNQAVLDYIREHRPRHVLLISWWGPRTGEAEFPAKVTETVRALNALGAQVWVLKDVPVYAADLPKLLLREVRHGRDPLALGLPQESYRAQLAPIDRAFHPLAGLGVHLLDPERFLIQEDQRCAVMWDGVPAYFDSNHLTRTGSEMLRPLLESVVRSARRADFAAQPAAAAAEPASWSVADSVTVPQG